MVKVLQKKLQELVSIDASFKQELPWLGQCGQTALDETMQERFLSCMPDGKQFVALRECCY